MRTDTAKVLVQIHGLCALGDSVGRRASDMDAQKNGGPVVFVPGGAPGELVEVQITERRRDYLRGRLLRVVTEGHSRVTPACDKAGDRCGGCPYMHVSRKDQLLAKAEQVKRALRHTGAEILPMLDPLADPYGYRIRVRLVQHGGVLGYTEARSHRTTAFSSCVVLHPALFAPVKQVAHALGSALGEEGSLFGLLSTNLEVHLAATVVPDRGGSVERTEQVLASAQAQGIVAGATLQTQQAEPSPPVWSLGAPWVDLGGEELGPLLLPADGFAQASQPGHLLLPKLVATEAEGSGKRVLELYAGTGNLTRALWQSAPSFLLSLEGDRAAAARLAGLFGSSAPAFSARHGDAQKEVEKLVQKDRLSFDVVVLDPPRQGAKDVMPYLRQLGASRIVYVSCDPMTLGRDLGILTKDGYVATRVYPIDLTPHTAHVEVVAVLERARG